MMSGRLSSAPSWTARYEALMPGYSATTMASSRPSSTTVKTSRARRRSSKMSKKRCMSVTQPSDSWGSCPSLLVLAAGSTCGRRSSKRVEGKS